jgi:hypothetical protein
MPDVRFLRHMETENGTGGIEAMTDTAWVRPRDEYGRAWYAPNETPPATEHFAHWKGRLTHPSATHTPLHANHARMCKGGWIASGDWWLHCGICRPKAGAGLSQ